MLENRHVVEEHVVLGAYAKGLAELRHIGEEVVSVYVHVSTRWGDQPGEHRNCSSFTGSVMPK